MTDLPEIVEILRHHPWSKEAVDEGYCPLFQKAGIAPETRARILVEDMAAINCDWPIRSTPVNEHVVLSHYEIPDTDFGQTDDESISDSLTAHGSGLNWGSVVRLSKACEAGRSIFGSDWPKKFKAKLLNTKEHLSFIEEILWLNLWRGISDVQSEAQPFLSGGCKKRVDWRFSACDQIVNLEVKYRPRDWARHVDGPGHLVMPSYFYDVPDKFPKKNADEINLLAVSSPASIDRSLRERTENLLKEHSTIDGAIIWAQASNSDSPFEIHASKDKRLIELLFTGGDLEDAAHIGLVRHPWRKREERRSFRSDEAPEILRRLANDHNTSKQS